jgi:hypothetical protein
MNHQVAACLSDEELMAAVKRLARCERESTAQLILHLAEFDKRRLYLGAGFSSLFRYCTEELRLSEYAAYHRILAARVARRFPIALQMLAGGSLNLTSVRLLAPHVGTGNHGELFAAAADKSKRDLQELLARRFPQPDVPSAIRKLPDSRPPGEPTIGPELLRSATLEQPAGPSALPAAPSHVRGSSMAGPPSPLPKPRPSVTPLAPERYQITFTACATTRDKLRFAQDLMRHTLPSGDTAALFDEALTALLEKMARRKFADTASPRTSRGCAEGSRHISAAVRRAVWVRDLGCCAFVSRDGRHCRERGFVEFHHLVPHGVGGSSTVGNLELRCRAHNAYEAALYYGARAAGPINREASACS